MRLMSQVRLLAWVISPNSSAKRCRSWPTLRRSSTATSCRMFSCIGFSFLGLSRRSARVDSEPRFAAKRKVIRDKEERFFERKKGQEIVVAVVESASGADPEGPSVGRKSYGCESQASVCVQERLLCPAGVSPVGVTI